MSDLPESARESHAAGALTDAARGNYYCNHPGMTCSGCVVKVDGEGMLEDLRMEGWDLAPVSPAVEEPGHERCACGNAATEGLGEGTYWFADNALWNAVNGSPNGFLCPPCFTTMAREKGYAVGWRAGVIGEIETDPADVARLRAEVERLRAETLRQGQRITELDALLVASEEDAGRLRKQNHEAAATRDRETAELRSRVARYENAYAAARERLSDLRPAWTNDPPSQSPGGWWKYTSANHADEAAALFLEEERLARDNRTLTRLVREIEAYALTPDPVRRSIEQALLVIAERAALAGSPSGKETPE